MVVLCENCIVDASHLYFFVAEISVMNVCKSFVIHQFVCVCLCGASLLITLLVVGGGGRIIFVFSVMRGCQWLLVVGVCWKGTRWMPWHFEPMKDVEGRDRPRGVVNQALIRGCPNGETWLL